MAHFVASLYHRPLLALYHNGTARQAGSTLGALRKALVCKALAVIEGPG
jgi:hypothetical protein